MYAVAIFANTPQRPTGASGLYVAVRSSRSLCPVPAPVPEQVPAGRRARTGQDRHFSATCNGRKDEFMHQSILITASSGRDSGSGGCCGCTAARLLLQHPVPIQVGPLPWHPHWHRCTAAPPLGTSISSLQGPPSGQLAVSGGHPEGPWTRLSLNLGPFSSSSCFCCLGLFSCPVNYVCSLLVLLYNNQHMPAHCQPS